MRRISYNFTILPWHQQDYITHYTIHGHADTSEIDGDEAPECGAGYPAAQTLQTGGRPWTSGPGLGVSSGVTLCLIVCWGERVVSRCVTIGPDYITRGLYIHLSFNNETKIRL